MLILNSFWCKDLRVLPDFRFVCGRFCWVRIVIMKAKSSPNVQFGVKISG
jgi:hypothetical protein